MLLAVSVTQMQGQQVTAEPMTSLALKLYKASKEINHVCNSLLRRGMRSQAYI